MTAFLDQRLADAAKKAEERAERDEAAEKAALEQVDFLKKRFAEARRQLIRDAMRAIHGAPPLVIPHLHPRPRVVPARDRFSLVELE